MGTNSHDFYQSLLSEDYGMIFKAIMEHSKDGLFVTDHLGNVVMLNRATEEMCETHSSEVLGRNVADLVNEGYWDISVSLQVIETQRAVSLIQITRNNKKLLSTGIPIFDADDQLKYVLVNDRDISFLSSLFETLTTEENDDNLLQFELTDYSQALSEIEGLVVRSPAMAKVLQAVVRAAKFDIPLVFTGESGVGKTMIARLTHHLSERREGPFVDLNCGAITESLLESELFGHEAGAFTGAAPGGKKGLLEVAHGGTLFLDEIGEIPSALQVKLLKFLETKEVLRVGAVKPQKIDTRIIAATHHHLEALMESGAFRSDLYFRLNVVPIHIPALRERKEEIEPLAKHFLDQFNDEFKTRKTISGTARLTLCQYDFPGNVRELENIVKRLVTMTEDDTIGVGNLPSVLLDSIAAANGDSHGERRTLQEVVATFEQNIIADAVAKHGSQHKAARALGISQSTLSRKLKTRPPKQVIHG